MEQLVSAQTDIGDCFLCSALGLKDLRRRGTRGAGFKVILLGMHLLVFFFAHVKPWLQNFAYKDSAGCLSQQV